jgi:SAM-dependent methyltransferase
MAVAAAHDRSCFVCTGTAWRPLPVPAPSRSITTSGIIQSSPLEREQCMTCGLLQAGGGRMLGHSRFYEEQYRNYYERPNVEKFDRARYAAMAGWMVSALDAGFAPRTILDVGCGAGWSMTATGEIYSGAAIAGIEPSVVNAEKARRAGFEVSQGRLGETGAASRKHDLIYSNNVLQHVTDPASFFGEIAAQLADNGRIALLLPDASEPSNEMMWCDHNFSFRPDDVARLAARAGLEVINWQSNPRDNALLNKQIVILKRQHGSPSPAVIPQSRQPADLLFAERAAYMMKWPELDRELTRRTAGHARVFNFGASMWSWLLAGYCPAYWQSVHGCLVDGGSGTCIDKPVASPSEFAFTRADCIVLGINPANQDGFAARLQGLGATVIGWSDIVTS